WVGDGRRSSTTAFNAFMGLVAFGYPGFMWAVFGRFTWRSNPVCDDCLGGLTNIDSMQDES
ncbi:MAG: hypothetical protein AAF664_10760, partial [Planctomycetota bacterium]